MRCSFHQRIEIRDQRMRLDVRIKREVKDLQRETDLRAGERDFGVSC